MKKTRIVLGVLLALAMPGGAIASGDIPLSSRGDAAPFQAMAGNVDAHRPAAYGLCPAIAEVPQVRNRGIDYIRTRDFAEAVAAVANGTSDYSPAKVPAEWKGAATLWRESVSVGGKARIALVPGEGVIGGGRAALLSPNGAPVDPMRFGLGESSCNPDLLFRASLEYRFRKDREDAPLLYPHLVRKAASGIEKRVAAKMTAAAAFAKRADDLDGRILQAEKEGAARCLPRELARVKAELAIVRSGIEDIDFEPAMIEGVLAKAEPLAGTLVEVRSYAALHGIRCASE